MTRNEIGFSLWRWGHKYQYYITNEWKLEEVDKDTEISLIQKWKKPKAHCWMIYNACSNCQICKTYKLQKESNIKF